MFNTILDGKALSNKIKEQIKQQVIKLKNKPKIVVIRIGEDKASKVYIKMKKRASKEVGMNFEEITFNEDVKEEKVLKEIKKLNKDSKVHGILVQLPIPSHLNKEAIINKIADEKDVDGLKQTSQIIPCTALGVIKILENYSIKLSSKKVLIIGRSKLVGRPLINLLLNKNATVISANSYTKNLKELTKIADIIISATGKKDLIKKNMLKRNQILIDVGINKVDGKLYGDINKNCYPKASAYTPVPGGVGPMTVAMLLSNTLDCYRRQENE